MARHPQAHALVLMQHGLVTWGATARAAYNATIELVSRAENLPEQAPHSQPGHAAIGHGSRAEVPQACPGHSRGLGSSDAGTPLGDRVILEPLLDPEVAQWIRGTRRQKSWALSAAAHKRLI